MHDTVAQKNFDPVLPPLPDDLEDELEEESVKIVRLVKNKEPLVSRTGAEIPELNESPQLQGFYFQKRLENGTKERKKRLR